MKQEVHCGTLAQVLEQRSQQAVEIGLNGKVETCEFVYLVPPDYQYNRVWPEFSYLGLNVQEMFLTGRPQTPVERTLLTSGVTATAVRSRHYGRPIETPFLNISYKPYDFSPIRPKGRAPTGVSLAHWPPEDIKDLFGY